MQNFIFHNPVKIVFGRGSIAELPNLVPADAKIMMTYGGGSIRKNGVYDQVQKALRGREVVEFGGIEPNPRYETCMKAVERVRAEGVSFLLAVGGGSVLDGTKFIAAASVFKGKDPWDMLSDWSLIPADPLPIGCVLTLPATGSEMNGGAVISRNSTQEKLFFIVPQLLPRFSILDPETTFTLPPRQTANGVVDAFVHTTEQYLTFPADGALQDRQAEGILLTLIEAGPRALREPTNYAARANLMWCATAGAQRADLLRRSARLGHAHDRPRVDGPLRRRSCPIAGHRVARRVAARARAEAGQVVAICRAGVGRK